MIKQNDEEKLKNVRISMPMALHSLVASLVVTREEKRYSKSLSMSCKVTIFHGGWIRKSGTETGTEVLINHWPRFYPFFAVSFQLLI